LDPPDRILHICEVLTIATLHPGGTNHHTENIYVHWNELPYRLRSAHRTPIDGSIGDAHRCSSRYGAMSGCSVRHDRSRYVREICSGSSLASHGSCPISLVRFNGSPRHARHDRPERSVHTFADPPRARISIARPICPVGMQDECSKMSIRRNISVKYIYNNR